MTPKVLARAGAALREVGIAEQPVAATKIVVVGNTRRMLIAVVCGILPVALISRDLGFDKRSYLVEALGQLAIAVVLVVAFLAGFQRVTKRDPLLSSLGTGIMFITERGLHILTRRGVRRTWTPTLRLASADVSLAQLEPRRSMFDPPRLVLRRFRGEPLTYELPERHLMDFAKAVAELRQDRADPSSPVY